MNNFDQIIKALESLKEDPVVIKKVKEKADQIIFLLQDHAGNASGPVSEHTKNEVLEHAGGFASKHVKQNPDDFVIDKALRELEELDSSEIPPYDRTQLWDIISLLESSAHQQPQ